MYEPAPVFRTASYVTTMDFARRVMMGIRQLELDTTVLVNQFWKYVVPR
jgi:hypothetical protein